MADEKKFPKSKYQLFDADLFKNFHKFLFYIKTIKKLRKLVKIYVF